MMARKASQCAVYRSWRSMRPLVAGSALLLALAACTSASRSTSDSFRLLFKRDVRATPTQVAANRYPQIQLSAPDMSAVMVLGYVDDGQQAWYAGKEAVFHLDRDGLVTGTNGNGRQITTRIVGDSPFHDLAAIIAPVQVQRQYDATPAYAVSVPVTGTLVRHGTDKVDILGRQMQLVRFEERLEGGGISATNLYWADASTGFIWKSRQHLAPGYAVELTQLKPYRPAQD
ncbi:YjbF family lipoprotein [Stenotrophomonas chelatiphaga]|uniref:YjbF family lipoprotein n=1 Tax=Stenotrophomonas chelatiphaga TaxID=517011 RepID=UPI0028A0F96D|nr:YjbF family lipoprotein [Stenotrophomonas chelatiphaga]